MTFAELRKYVYNKFVEHDKPIEVEFIIKTFILWFILKFNREKSYLLDMRQTNYSMWLTGTKNGNLRLNHTEPGGGGSTPVKKVGLFGYESIGYPERIDSGVDEAEKWCSPIWFNFLIAPWTLGARKTTR